MASFLRLLSKCTGIGSCLKLRGGYFVPTQARLDEERRQLAAAREVARERQAQLIDKVAAQQQLELAALGEAIEERLKEAAARCVSVGVSCVSQLS